MSDKVRELYGETPYEAYLAGYRAGYGRGYDDAKDGKQPDYRTLSERKEARDSEGEAIG